MPTQTVWIDHDRWVREVALKQECTCPVCRMVWQHKDDVAWIKEHFSSLTEPVECSECGTLSVAGNPKRYGPRKIYVEPTPEPTLTRTERGKPGWFGRAREVESEYERGR